MNNKTKLWHAGLIVFATALILVLPNLSRLVL